MRSRKPIGLLCVLLAAILPLAAQTPLGGNAIPNLYSPALVGSGAFVTGTGSSQNAAVNPAASALEQLPILDLGYDLLMGFGADAGVGHLLGGGLVLPTKAAVFSASLRFVTSPFAGTLSGVTALQVNGGVSKELYPGFSVGLGVQGAIGTDWSLGADLGVRHNLGKLGPLEDFTWAFVLGGLGKGWTPAAFSPVGGVSFDLLRLRAKSVDAASPLRIGVKADIGAPGFATLTGQLGLEAEIAGLVTISTSSGFDLAEAVSGNAVSPIPSIGITVNLSFDRAAKTGGKLPEKGSLAPTISARPLYRDVWAFGAGAVLTIGVADTRAPDISINYPNPLWISPNNDGKSDALELPISITDSRYVVEWVFEVKDASGAVVRTLRNKERRPETSGFKGLLSRVLDVKSGVEVPATLRWDGNLDSGERAPDGKYTFSIAAKDDNGNASASSAHEVWIDTAPPAITIQSGDALRILSPDGDGNKDSFPIAQTGSVEDQWTAGIYDAAGNLLKAFSFASAAPAAIVWDGKADSGRVVPDGVYRYQISATDRAGNIGTAAMDNIIVNTERPTVTLILDGAWFSPNGDGVQDTLTFSPGVPVKEGIERWTLEILDAREASRRTLAGDATVPGKLIFDGKLENGSLLAEASYRARLSVTYRNGNVAQATSPEFTLDVTAPEASARADVPAFSPNGDGSVDTIGISQTGSAELAWTGEIRRTGAREATRSFRFEGAPPARVEWDGRDDSGRPSADGSYEYTLSATDRAGNRGSSGPTAFTLSTADTPLFVTTELAAFSPNGDGTRDTIGIVPQLQLKTGIAAWKVDVLNEAGAVVRTWEGGSAAPGTLVWNGRDARNQALPEGIYTARADVRYTMGNRPVASSVPFALDMTAPSLELSAPYTVFSPNGDSRKDTIPFAVATAGDDAWTARILSASGAEVQAWAWKGKAPELVWNGTDKAGNVVPNGAYRLVVRSEDAAGNRTERSVDGLAVDNRATKVFLTASAAGLSPNADGAFDTVRFSLIVNNREGIENWSLDILDENGAVVRSQQGSASAIPATWDWDGTDSAGKIVEGKRTARLSVSYQKGDVAEAVAGPLVVDITPPRIGFATSPRYFSPDNDGVEDELAISLDASDNSAIATWSLEILEPQPPFQNFYRFTGSGTPAGKLVWDGRSSKGELVQAATDYTAVLTAADAWGNKVQSRHVIGVDVLVMNEGGQLKIKVPSIIFRENGNDFNGLAQDKIDNNERVLRRIAEILNKFREYRIKVEGHANPVARTAQEERELLQPLSQARAETVMKELIRYGVDRDRLSAVGMGGTRPVARFDQRDDWWKNRRVEFILIK